MKCCLNKESTHYKIFKMLFGQGYTIACLKNTNHM